MRFEYISHEEKCELYMALDCRKLNHRIKSAAISIKWQLHGRFCNIYAYTYTVKIVNINCLKPHHISASYFSHGSLLLLLFCWADWNLSSCLQNWICIIENVWTKAMSNNVTPMWWWSMQKAARTCKDMNNETTL